MPRSILSRASTENLTSLADILDFLEIWVSLDLILRSGKPRLEG